MNSLGTRLRRIAMASTALIALPILAAAQDATWIGPGTTLNDGANWSGGAVPSGTGIFTGQGPVTPVLQGSPFVSLGLGGLRFDAGAPAHTFDLTSVFLNLNTSGIVNQSGVVQTFVFQVPASPSGLPGQISLRGAGSLGTNVRIVGQISGVNSTTVELRDTASAGAARVENLRLFLTDNASGGTVTGTGIRLNMSRNANLGNAVLSLRTELAGPSTATGDATLGAAILDLPTAAPGQPANALELSGNASGGTASINLGATSIFDITRLGLGGTATSTTLGRLTGEGRVLLGDRTLVLIGPGSTFAGVFEGSSNGGVTFASGTTTLTGTSTLTGNFLVSSGATLLVDGNTQSVSTTFVDAGGTLGGIGTVGRVFLDGTLSPGNAASPVGTLAVTGNLAMGPGATLRVDVGAGGADRVNVSGTAVPDGTLQVVPTAGFLPTNGQTYTIVQAGSVQGTFAAVTDPLAYFDFTPVYTATQVNLVATQLPFNNPAATGGARNLGEQGNALDRYAAGATSNADFNAVLAQLLRLSPAQAVAAGHSASGESYASFTTVGLEQLDRFRYAALDAAGSCEGRGGEMRGRWCAWADAYYVSASLDGAGDLAGFDYTLSGVQGGVETRVLPDAVVGLTLGYGNQRMRNFDFASRRITGDALFAGVYGTYGMGPWQVAGLLGYSHFDVDGERDIAIGSIARQARSNFGADGVNAALALRYRADLGGFRVEPEALVAFTQYWQDGFTETGADSLNLRVNGSDANSFVTGIGVRASTEFSIEGRMVRPFALLRYEHDWLAGEKEDHRVNASFAQVPEAGSWTVFGQNRGRENLIGRLGVVGEITSNVALFGTVGGQLNSNGSEWGVGGGVRVTF